MARHRLLLSRDGRRRFRLLHLASRRSSSHRRRRSSSASGLPPGEKRMVDSDARRGNDPCHLRPRPKSRRVRRLRLKGVGRRLKGVSRRNQNRIKLLRRLVLNFPSPPLSPAASETLPAASEAIPAALIWRTS